MKLNLIYSAKTLKSSKQVEGQLLITTDIAPKTQAQKPAYWIVVSATSRGGWVAVGTKHKVDPSTITLKKET